MKTYLAIPVSVIPDWTKQNVPTYPLGLFSNDGSHMLIDNAHPVTTYNAWLGPNIALMPVILAQSRVYSHDEITALKSDPNSIWYRG